MTEENKLFIPAVAIDRGKRGKKRMQRTVYLNRNCITWVDITRRVIKTTDGEEWRYRPEHQSQVFKTLELKAENENDSVCKVGFDDLFGGLFDAEDWIKRS